MSQTTTRHSSKAFNYTPDEYPEDLTLHWCLPGNNHDERTFKTREYHSGELHQVELNYIKNPLLPHTTRERYNSITAARASRRIKQGHASDCPFCTDKPFNFANTRLKHQDQLEGWQAETLKDFQHTIIESCRPQQKSNNQTVQPDINFSEITTNHHGQPALEILTNTSQLRTAYPQIAKLPNWYTLAYAIAQNPWLQVEEKTKLKTDHTRILLTAKQPNPNNYGRHYFKLLSQRDNAPKETKTT